MFLKTASLGTLRFLIMETGDKEDTGKPRPLFGPPVKEPLQTPIAIP